MTNSTAQSLIIFLIIFVSVSCDSQENNLILELRGEEGLEQRVPIYYNGEFALWNVNSDFETKNLIYLKIDVPDTIMIPTNSKISVGYVDFLRTVGVRIDPGSSKEYYTKYDTLRLDLTKEMIVELKKTDPLLVDTVLNIMKQVVGNDSLDTNVKNDSN